MQEYLKTLLFNKKYLVADGKPENRKGCFETVYALRRLLGIRITSGEELAEPYMIDFASSIIGVRVSEAFYRGFPNSVRELSPDKKLFDQFVHYSMTYGFGMFENTGHSVMEEYEGRSEFTEATEDKCFDIIDEEKAVSILREYVENILSGTRPARDIDIYTICCFVEEYDYKIPYCASMHTAVTLIRELRKPEIATYIKLSDVIKLVEVISSVGFFHSSIHELNLKNQDRKLIKEVIDTIFLSGRCDITTCFEKKEAWNGLLHHIHYKPVNEQAEYFVNCIRGGESKSVYSAFEKAVGEGRVKDAVTILRESKGETMVLRKLEYILSRCQSTEEVLDIISSISSKNGIVLLQLYKKYKMYDGTLSPRTFTFTKNNRLVVYTESRSKMKKRKTVLNKDVTEAICKKIEEEIKAHFAHRFSKVYISEEMKNIALPIEENASSGGFGILPKGSRLHIPEGKKIRAFTYWEKVNDVDLSAIGIKDDGTELEFSWRTMASLSEDCILFSGDETSGYKGGAEYFDIDINMFREIYPNVEYLVFSDNVYSAKMFSVIDCRAGYMLRDIEDSGEIFEPKTVQTSFKINCDSTFAYLFAIDLTASDFIWLNLNREGVTTVAGNTSFEFLRRYFHMTDIINVYDFISMCADEIVDDALAAELVVSDEELELPDDIRWIHSYDTDALINLME